MPVASVVPAGLPRTADETEPVEPTADVLPFSRENLGRGARDGLVDRLNDYSRRQSGIPAR